MCCGDSTSFQEVFRKAEDFLDSRGLYFLFFYLMNIISKSSKHFQLAHLIKATVLNLVAYSSHTLEISKVYILNLVLEAGRGMRLVDSNPNRFTDSNSESMIEFHVYDIILEY